MLRLSRILETCLYATDLARSARFYEEVLGLEPLSSVEGRHAFFRLPGAMFLLFQPERTAESEEVPPHGSSGPGHVAFSVEAGELDAWRHRLSDHGIAVEKEVRWPRGGVSIYLRDPAGNSIELATPDIWPLEP